MSPAARQRLASLMMDDIGETFATFQELVRGEASAEINELYT